MKWNRFYAEKKSSSIEEILESRNVQTVSKNDDQDEDGITDTNTTSQSNSTSESLTTIEAAAIKWSQCWTTLLNNVLELEDHSLSLGV